MNVKCTFSVIGTHNLITNGMKLRHENQVSRTKDSIHCMVEAPLKPSISTDVFGSWNVCMYVPCIHVYRDILLSTSLTLST